MSHHHLLLPGSWDQKRSWGSNQPKCSLTPAPSARPSCAFSRRLYPESRRPAGSEDLPLDGESASRLFLTSSSGLCPSVYSLSRHCPGPALSSSATGHAVPVTGRRPRKRRGPGAAVGSGGSPGGLGLLPAEAGVTLAGRAPTEWMLSGAADAAGHRMALTQGPGPAAAARVLALPGTQLSRAAVPPSRRRR